MSNSKQYIYKRRKISYGALLVYLGIGAFFAILIVQFFMLMTSQSLNDEDLVAHGESRYLRTAINEASRGNIMDRDQNVLASDMNTYRLAIITDDNYPYHVKDVDKTARDVASVISMDASEIKEIIELGIDNSRFQVEFGTKGRDLTYNQKVKLEELNVEGLILDKDKRRLYPNGNFASNLIGYAEKDKESDEIIGQIGIEQAYNEFLTGQHGQINFTKDLWDFVVPNSDTVNVPEDGYDIQLTIDSNIQLFVEDSLNIAVEHFEPEEVFAVVMDVHTGEILATGQRPSFNPETREGYGENWLNFLYQSTYEPGSTFKVFGIGAAFDSGVYDPDETFESGQFEIGEDTIYDWNLEGWGEITYNQGFQYSSNALMMTLQDEVGTEKMYEYYKEFGFGSSTDSELPNEPSGIITWDNEVNKKTTSFGQGITVTPIQMLQAFTMFFNEGQMKKPYVVDAIINPETGEYIYDGKETIIDQVISKEAAESTIEEMNTLINGSEQRSMSYYNEGFEVAGKSGTAQVVDYETGTYMTEDYSYFSSFIGYAPKDDPEVAIYYGIKLPSQNKSDIWDYGVSIGFNPLMERTLNYLDVENDEGILNVQPVGLENYEGESLTDVSDSIINREGNNVIIGDGEKILTQYPKSGRLHHYDTFIVLTDGDAVMPDLIGMSKREVYIIAEMLDIEIAVEGEGYVTTQSIAPGGPIQNPEGLTITLSTHDPNN